MSNFIPSQEQQAIFDAWADTDRNLAIKAGAGTGKTTTLVELLKRYGKQLTPRGNGRFTSALFCAFNKDIVYELQDRLTGTGVKAKTFHSIGYGALAKHLGGKLDVQGDKYTKLAEAALEDAADYKREYAAAVDAEFARLKGEVGDAEAEKWAKRYGKKLHRNTVTLVKESIRYMQVKLQDPDDIEALRYLAHHYALDLEIESEELIYAALRTVPGIMDESRAMLAPERGRVISFTDMIYYPVTLAANAVWKNDYVFVDECQDLSPCQRALVDLSLKRGGRIVVVGDPRQAIYEFAGADSDSFALSVNQWDCDVLPLSLTRRCDWAITRRAQGVVPDFYALPDKGRGKVVYVDEGHMTRLAQPGDMILCRVKAPMVRACLDLLRAGTPASIRGGNIGAKLAGIVEDIFEMPGFAFEAFSDFADKHYEKKLYAVKEDERMTEQLHDEKDALLTLVRAADSEHLPEITAYIKSLFHDDDRGGTVVLSTVHKAKGTEADRVFILAPDKLPLMFAGMGGEAMLQEQNLLYVAITRAKHTLVFLTNARWRQYNDVPAYGQTEMDAQWGEDDPLRANPPLRPQDMDDYLPQITVEKPVQAALPSGHAPYETVSIDRVRKGEDEPVEGEHAPRLPDGEVNPSFVAEHVRNLPDGKSATPRARRLAAQYGITLKPGQTFVSPHERDPSEASEDDTPDSLVALRESMDELREGDGTPDEPTPTGLLDALEGLSADELRAVKRVIDAALDARE